MKKQKMAIGVVDGRFDYPSTRGKGFDAIDYERRAPMVGGKIGALQTVTLKMRELPDAVIHDLTAAHQGGHLREELNRHLGLLEALQYVDAGTLQLLHSFANDLTGDHGPDGETLQCVNELLASLRPEERQP